MSVLAHAGRAAAPTWASWPGPPVIRLDEVGRVFGAGAQAVAALDGISLEVGQGEFICVVGASGCGKSTLLSLIAGLDRPTSGRLEVEGSAPALMFQDAALLPWLTVARNVELPMRLRGAGRRERAAPTSSAGGCASVSRSPVLSPSAPRSCSWTSPSPRSTPSPVTSSTRTSPASPSTAR
jgi:energy-coupling factor transporter ATP-binding protein EcfA2